MGVWEGGRGGGFILLYNRHRRTFDTIDNSSSSFQFRQRMKIFPAVADKGTRAWCAIEGAISCIVKSVRKLRGLTESRAEDIKILRFFDMLVFKNTKWPTGVYMLFVPKSTGRMSMTLGPRTRSLLAV